MKFSAETELSLNLDAVVWREVGDELLILELDTATYLTVNGSARLLWSRLEEGATLADLVDCLVVRYGISQDQAHLDVGEFLSDLEGRSLVRVANALGD